jgi:HPt (histidine-containing phosphotransfer) domain-containing protein
MNADESEAGGDTVIDWRAARNLTGGDENLLNDLVELFPQEGAKHLAAIKTAIEHGDVAALTRAAHTLKSSAKLFGAQALADCAQQIENLNGDVDAAAERLPELERETKRVVAALNQGEER